MVNSSRILLIGKERFLKEEAVAETRSKLFRASPEADLNFQSFEVENDGISGFLDFLATAPFLAEVRLGVLWGMDALEEEDGERLVAALDKLPSTACLILESEQTNVRKDPLLEALSEKLTVRPCHPPFENDLPAWIQARAKKKNLSLGRGLAPYLIERVGTELSGLENALEELAVYVHPKHQADLEDAKRLLEKTSVEDVFELADCLLENKKKEALRIADALYRAGTRAPEIVGALNGQLERFKRALGALAQGRSRADLAEEMRVPRMHQAAFFSKLEKTDLGRLKKLQRALLECDESFKTGLSQERLSVEQFILRS